MPSRRVQDRHFLSIDRMAPDIGFDRPLFFGRRPMDQREISFFYRPLFDLFDQGAISWVGFGGDDHAGRLFVQTMDDPGTQGGAERGEPAAMVKQGIDQCSLIISGSGVDDQPFWFIYDNYLVILMNNIQRNFLGLGRWSLGSGDFDGDLIGDLDLGASLGLFPV